MRLCGVKGWVGGNGGNFILPYFDFPQILPNVSQSVALPPWFDVAFLPSAGTTEVVVVLLC